MHLLRLSLAGLFTVAVTLLSPTPASHAAEIPMYIGCYTKPGQGQGIYLSHFNTETGALSAPELVVESVSPSFLVQHPTKKFIYAVNETASGVSAFAMEEGGKLRELNKQPSLGGGPTHISIDRDGQNVVVSNYGGGSVACLPIAADGSLKPVAGFVQHTGTGGDPAKPLPPHAHSSYFDKANKHVYTADAGLDKVFVYRFNAAAGSLEPADPAFVSPGVATAPRHMAFSEGDAFIYVLNEHSCTITVYAREEGQAVLHEIQSIETLPDGKPVKGDSTAEIFIHPNHKFLYSSNRGNNTIAAFAIGAEGKLTLISHTPTGGDHPRYFGIDPTGKFLLIGNMLSNTIVVEKIDQETGKLAPVGEPVKCFSPSNFLFTK